MMRQWKLWHEEANDEPLFTGPRSFTNWLSEAGFNTKISYSTYLPPHLFYLLKGKLATGCCRPRTRPSMRCQACAASAA